MQRAKEAISPKCISDEVYHATVYLQLVWGENLKGDRRRRGGLGSGGVGRKGGKVAVRPIG